MMTGEERFLAACRRQEVDTTPVWFMRQAGRCLAEYRELREKYDILTMTRTPELCAQVTLMPVEKFGVDAAVLYADIMLPLEGMGVPFQIDPGVGPIIPDPIRTAADVSGLKIIDAEEATPYLFETIRALRPQLNGKTALIGFAGAPYTVASYMIEGRPTKDFGKAKSLMYGQPGVWHELMETLAEVTTRYLRAQVEAGVQVVQLFDSWVGSLGRPEYEAYVLPHTRRIFQGLHDLRVPLIHFGTGASHLLEPMSGAGCDIVSVDWRLPLDQAWDRIGRARGIQGNLDPTVLLAPWPVIEREAKRVLTFANSETGHIFNLGHGVLADTPADNLTRLVELVHETAARPSTVQPDPQPAAATFVLAPAVMVAAVETAAAASEPERPPVEAEPAASETKPEQPAASQVKPEQPAEAQPGTAEAPMTREIETSPPAPGTHRAEVIDQPEIPFEPIAASEVETAPDPDAPSRPEASTQSEETPPGAGAIAPWAPSEPEPHTAPAHPEAPSAEPESQDHPDTPPPPSVQRPELPGIGADWGGSARHSEPAEGPGSVPPGLEPPLPGHEPPIR